MRFHQAFGWPANPPERAWQPWLGDRCHVSPSEVGDLSCEQLLACLEYATGGEG